MFKQRLKVREKVKNCMFTCIINDAKDSIKHQSDLCWYLKLFEENLGERLPEVRRAEDGLDDDHPSVARIHQEVPGWDQEEEYRELKELLEFNIHQYEQIKQPHLK